MPLDIQGTFVSQKINKVRWIPEDFAETKYFFTGSWDDDINSIKVWCLEPLNEDEDAECPRQLSEYKVEGDVTEIKFTDKRTIAASFSNGDVKMLEVSAYDKQAPLREVHSWKNLHNFGAEKCSCTSLDTLEGDVVSIGEDGNVNILNGRRGEVSQTIKGADSCSLHSVCFIKLNEVITGNIRGHMKIWDIRSSENKPAAAFLLAGDELAATCIARHPTQPHVVLAGSESGSLAVWDLRMNQFPTSLLAAHAAGVTEMQFHPQNPNKLLTASLSGEVWDWHMEALTRGGREDCAPLAGAAAVRASSLLPALRLGVSSLHAARGRLLCAADNEAVYLVSNLKY